MSDLLHSLVEDCYLALLRIPHSSPQRVRNDPLMARCRDYLAMRRGRTPEEVQNEFEHIAAKLIFPLGG